MDSDHIKIHIQYSLRNILLFGHYDDEGSWFKIPRYHSTYAAPLSFWRYTNVKIIFLETCGRHSTLPDRAWYQNSSNLSI